MAVFVFLFYVAAGLAFSLAIVRMGDEGRNFFLFNAALALVIGGISLGSRLLVKAGTGDAVAGASRGFAVLGGSGLALLAIYLLVGALGSERRVLLRAGALLLALGVLVDAHDLHPSGAAAVGLPGGSVGSLLHAANAGTSAWLAGSILLAMILGHFYLVIPKLSIDPLRRLFRFSLVGLGARIALVGTAGVLWWSAAPHDSLTVAAFLHQGVFVLQRVLFGLAIPTALGYFTWKTIEMRSTQSATGILYVVVFLTLVGEALSVYLSLETRIPL